MAGAQYTGGKSHSATEAKAILRHNDKACRKDAKHDNPHIDPDKTCRNNSYYGLSYEEKCDKYDRLVAQGIAGRSKKPGTGKNAPVTMQSIVIYEPEGMQDMPDSVAEKWFRAVCRLHNHHLMYGEGCMIDADFHFDEVHGYTDPETGGKKRSRRHMHINDVPLVDGKLNGKGFSSRGNMVKFNNAIQSMTERDFGMQWMDGTKRKGKATVEALKARSADAEFNAREADLRVREAEAGELLQEALDSRKEALRTLDLVNQMYDDAGNLSSISEEWMNKGYNAYDEHGNKISFTPRQLYSRWAEKKKNPVKIQRASVQRTVESMAGDILERDRQSRQNDGTYYGG